MSNIVERLQECRERSELSFRDLENVVGYSAGFLSYVHVGKRELTLEAAEKLAVVYRTTTAWLVKGDPKTNIWAEFSETARCRQVSDPAVSSSERLIAILDFIDTHYSGHLRYADVAKHLGLEPSVMPRLLSGTPPTKVVAHDVQQLTGVPSAWIELGNYAPLAGLGPIQTMSPDELTLLLELGIKAKAAGVPIENLHAALALLSGKGRA